MYKIYNKKTKIRDAVINIGLARCPLNRSPKLVVEQPGSS